MTREAMKQALEALETLARYENPETKIQVRKPKDGGPIVTMYPHKVASDAAANLRVAMIEQHLSYDGIHTCHAECQRPACVAVREAVEREREECAKVCDEYGQARYAAEAIRARGEK
jgi:hypothetical protein